MRSRRTAQRPPDRTTSLDAHCERTFQLRCLPLDTQRNSMDVVDGPVRRLNLQIFARYAVNRLMSISPTDVEVEFTGLHAVERLLTAAQCRAARALLNWSQDRLADASKVGISTISDFERDKRRPHDHLLRDIRSSFESAGVAFIDEKGGGSGGAGVWLRGAASTRPAAVQLHHL
jgi:DNA-binding transcriptional regulator YiaG